MTLQPLARLFAAASLSATVWISGAGAAPSGVAGDEPEAGCRFAACSTVCRCLFDRFDPERRLRYGYGMVADPAKAAYWYRRAAAAGDLRAQYNLALLIGRGAGVDRDLGESARLLEEAAARGLAEAAHALGNRHRLGHGVSFDLEAAWALYRQAAEAGYASAQHALGNLYADGRGVPADLVAAWLWWHRASERGHLLARAALTRAERLMSSDELRRARRRAEAATRDLRQP
ncbi:MAG: tetratricopeptide repeat protein [Geminicoccaceae bacterium]|nr:tetratricopeptide repeat protein [Geminicoccaceae bacterium]